MTTQIEKRTMELFAVTTALLLLAGGIATWQAVGQDMSNPHANFWRFVRQGIPGYSSTPAQGHTVLIQNGGENWREIRNSILMRYSQWVPGLALVAMALFYFFVGMDKLEKPRSGIMIERYKLYERIVHWYTAVLFVIMALTGLSILLGRVAIMPIVGHQVISGYLGASKILHNYCGPLLLIGILLEIIIWARLNIPRKSDLAWFKNMGGMLGGPRPHAGKINGGEKAWFWGVLVFGIAVGATGITMDFPLWGQTRFAMQVSHVIHVIMAVLFVAASFGHIYVGTIGAEGTFEAMWKGSVDAVWAQQHADLWYEEEMHKKGARTSS